MPQEPVLAEKIEIKEIKTPTMPFPGFTPETETKPSMTDKEIEALFTEKRNKWRSEMQNASGNGALGATNGKPVGKLTKVIKRDGAVVAFDSKRIVDVIEKAGNQTKEFTREVAADLAFKVIEQLNDIFDEQTYPTVEQIQDVVEVTLMRAKWFKTARAYIVYREEHAKMRQTGKQVPEEVKRLADESKQYFRNQLSEYVYYSMYSKWVPEKGRRETWVETVQRYNDFMRENLGNKLTEAEYEEIKHYMLSMKAMGSMRLLWGSGVAARSNHIVAYSCSFIAPTTWQDFGEIMYISMSGCGVGFSVERQNVERFPMIERQTGEKLSNHVVGDSKEGWADAFVHGLKTWAGGHDVDFDYSQVRPKGARLKTMGGRASGPDPLRALLQYSREKVLSRQGRRLTTLDVHDIICKTGEIVVAGGVRRSALISLSELDDLEMREAKNGQFYLTHPERSMANNSAVYNTKPSATEFLEEWMNLAKSGSGERGIFNRGGLAKQLPVRRWKTFARHAWQAGTNPCGEIILRSKQFCNLSEVVARAEDTEEDLMNKVRVATILGTYQATLTNFPYLSKEWKENCEEEALLGMSITGGWDCPALRNPYTMRRLKEVALETNREYAKRFEINPSTCVTCMKPSGNGSQLFNCSSGAHPRHALYYIRRVRVESHNPLFQLMKDHGVSYYPEVGYDQKSATTFVLEFPVKAPGGSVYKDDITALKQLEYWKMVKENFTEHNPSVTVSVGNDEWLAVGNWVYENWDMIGGLSFLPRADHVYRLAPFEAITEERYHEMIKIFPDIDFSKLVLYEYDDDTGGAKEYACVGSACELK